jgi:hypothetical protein
MPAFINVLSSSIVHRHPFGTLIELFWEWFAAFFCSLRGQLIAICALLQQNDAPSESTYPGVVL